MIRIRLLSKLADTIIVSGVKRTVILVPIKTHFDLSYYHRRARVLSASAGQAIGYPVGLRA